MEISNKGSLAAISESKQLKICESLVKRVWGS